MEDLLTRDYQFRERPTPFPGDARLAWRLATCLLILHYSRGKRASLRKLHYLGHALRTAEGRTSAAEDLLNERPTHRLILRVEPAIPRTLDFARGAGLSVLVKKSYRITAKGEAVVKEILEDNTLLVEEKQFLAHVQNRATEGRIDAILATEVNFGAQNQ